MQGVGTELAVAGVEAMVAALGMAQAPAAPVSRPAQPMSPPVHGVRGGYGIVGYESAGLAREGATPRMGSGARSTLNLGPGTGSAATATRVATRVQAAVPQSQTGHRDGGSHHHHHHHNVKTSLQAYQPIRSFNEFYRLCDPSPYSRDWNCNRNSEVPQALKKGPPDSLRGLPADALGCCMPGANRRPAVLLFDAASAEQPGLARCTEGATQLRGIPAQRRPLPRTREAGPFPIQTV